MDVNDLWKPVKASLRPKASRLVIAPCICKCCHLKPSSMIVGGASVASLACISASVWPTELPALLLGVSGVAVGVGPSYAMCISMAKERRELTSVDSAMFAVASSLGAGGVPFVMSRVLSRFGPPAFFQLSLGCPWLLLFWQHCCAAVLALARENKQKGSSKKWAHLWRKKTRLSRRTMDPLWWTHQTDQRHVRILRWQATKKSLTCQCHQWFGHTGSKVGHMLLWFAKSA